MNFHSFWLSNISLPHKLFARCLEVQLKRANLCYECTFLKALLMNWFPCRVQETVLQSNEWKALNFKHLFTKDNTTFYTKFWRKLRRGSDPVLLYLPEQLLLWKWNKIWTLSPVNVHGVVVVFYIWKHLHFSDIYCSDAEVLWLLISFWAVLL